jgi:hypothetical protein
MFGLFGGKKGKSAGKAPGKGGKAVSGGGKTPSRAEIIAQAQANARAARAEIGQENLNRMREAILRGSAPPPPPVSPGERARELIRGMDKGRLADQVKLLLEEDDR